MVNTYVSIDIYIFSLVAWFSLMSGGVCTGVDRAGAGEFGEGCPRRAVASGLCAGEGEGGLAQDAAVLVRGTIAGMSVQRNVL